jgi:hypothetical protein
MVPLSVMTSMMSYGKPPVGLPTAPTTSEKISLTFPYLLKLFMTWSNFTSNTEGSSCSVMTREKSPPRKERDYTSLSRKRKLRMPSWGHNPGSQLVMPPKMTPTPKMTTLPRGMTLRNHQPKRAITGMRKENTGPRHPRSPSRTTKCVHRSLPDWPGIR